jgi:hypothetical protein
MPQKKQQTKKTALPKYVFRGTTLGFPGNAVMQRIPVTCTTSNPAIATLFALKISHKFGVPAVVYVAETNKLAHISTTPENVLKKYEQEVAWTIKPIDFYTLCEGYVTVAEIQNVLSNLAIETCVLVFEDNLTNLLKQQAQIKPVITEQIVASLRPFLKH